MASSKTFNVATRFVFNVAEVPSWPTVQDLLQQKLDQGDHDNVFHLALRYILAITAEGQEGGNIALARLAWEGWDWACNRMLWLYQGYESEHEFVRRHPDVYRTVMERLTEHATTTELWDVHESQRHKSTQISIDCIQRILGSDGLYLCRPGVIGNPYSVPGAQKLWHGCWEKLGGRAIQLGKRERAGWAAAFNRAQTIKRTTGSFPTPRYMGTSKNRHKRRLAPPPPLPAPRAVADSLDGLTIDEMKQYHRQYCFAVNSLIDVVYEEVAEVEDGVDDLAESINGDARRDQDMRNMQEDLAPNDAPLEGTMVCTLKLGHSLLTLDQDIDVIEPTAHESDAMNQEPINEDPPSPPPDVDMQNAEENNAPQGGTMEWAIGNIGHSSHARDHEVQGPSRAGSRHPAVGASTDALDRSEAEVKELRLALEKADTAAEANRRLAEALSTEVEQLKDKVLQKDALLEKASSDMLKQRHAETQREGQDAERIKYLQMQHTSLTQMVENRNAEITRLNSDAAAAEEEHQVDQAESARQINELQQETAALAQKRARELKQANDEITALRNAASLAEATEAQLRAQMDDLVEQKNLEQSNGAVWKQKALTRFKEKQAGEVLVVKLRQHINELKVAEQQACDQVARLQHKMDDMFTANQQNTAELERQLDSVRQLSDAEITRMRQQQAEQADEVARWKQMAANMRTEVDTLDRALDCCKEENMKRCQSIDSLQQRNDAARHDVAILKARLREQGVEYETIRNADQARAKENETRASQENQRLSIQLQTVEKEKQAASSALAVSQEQAADLAREMERIKGDPELCRTLEIEQDGIRRDMRYQLLQLEESSRRAIERINVLEHSFDQGETELLLEIAKLDAKIDRLENEAVVSAAQVQRLESIKERLTSEVAMLEAEEEQLTGMLATFTNAQVEATEFAKAKAKRLVETLSEENASNEIRMAELVEALTAAKETIKEAEKNKWFVEAKNANLTRALAAANTAIGTLKREKADVQGENEKLVQGLAKAEQTLKESERDRQDVEAKSAHLERSLAAAVSTIGGLKRIKANTESKNGELAQKVAAAEQTIKHSERARGAAQTENARVVQLLAIAEQTIEKLKKGNAELKHENGELAKKIVRAKQIIMESKRDKATIQTENAQLAAALAAADSTNEDLKTDKAKFEKEKVELAEKLAEAEQRIQESERDKETVEAKNAQLAGALATADSTIEDLKKDTAKFEDEKVELAEKLAEAEQRITKSEKDKGVVETENTRLRQTNATAEQMIDSLKNERAATQRENAKLAKEVVEAEQKYNASAREKADVESRNVRLGRQLAKAEQSIKTLKQEGAEFEDKTGALEKKLAKARKAKKQAVAALLKQSPSEPKEQTAQLVRALATAEQAVNAAKEEKLALKKENVRLEQALRQLQSEQKAATGETVESDATVKQLEDRVTKQELENNRLQKLVDLTKQDTVDQTAKITAQLDRLALNFSHDSLFDLYKRLTTLAAMGMRAIAVLQDTEARYHRLPTVNVEFVLDAAQPLPSTLTSREVTRDAVAKGILGVASLVEDVPGVLGILSVRSLYNMLNSIADFAGNAPLYGNEIDWMLAAIRAGNVALELERRGAPVSHNEKVKCRRMYERIKTRITQAKVSDSGDGVTISRLNWVVLDGKLKRLEEGITTFPLE